MKRMASFFLVLMFTILLPATSSLAGSRYYSGHYYGGYRGHYYPYYPYHHGHSYHSHDSLAYLGVGLLTGAVIGSLLYQPPVERTVVYAAPPPPTIIQRSPVIITPQPVYRPDNEVLRQVRPTVRILNLRSGPGLDEEIVGQATFEEVLGVIGAAPDWLYVKTQNGQYGWVMTQYTQDLEGPVG